MFLIIDNYIHHKNKEGFKSILNYLNIEHKYGTEKDIDEADIIYSSSENLSVQICANRFKDVFYFNI